jgi:betaine-aldehyde dehydrogenase
MDHLQALNLIGGQWRPAERERQGDSINPATGLEIGSFAASMKADAQQAIAAARLALEHSGWARDPGLRQSLMLQWADRLESRGDLASLLTLENGKVLRQSQREIAIAIACLRRHAGRARDVADQTRQDDAHTFMLRQPAGVVGLIVPWNAPIESMMQTLAPALAAGCTAVIKPAPQSSQIVAAVIGELHAIAGLPAGAINLVLESGHEVVREIVASPAIDIISFKGSRETGRKITIAAAPTKKKLLLETCSKSCCVVLQDVDVEQIAPQLAAAATVVSGQWCTAAQHILVHVSRHQQMKSALKRALAHIVVAAGDAPDCDMGPLIDAPALLSAGIRIERALASCDEIILRGRHPGGALENGFFLSPTLVAHRDCMAFSGPNEILGPFVVLSPFADERDAATRANKLASGLAASVWAADSRRAMQVARALHHAKVWINHHDDFVEAPHRHAGNGAVLGMRGHHEELHGFPASRPPSRTPLLEQTLCWKRKSPLARAFSDLNQDPVEGARD